MFGGADIRKISSLAPTYISAISGSDKRQSFSSLRRCNEAKKEETLKFTCLTTYRK